MRTVPRGRVWWEAGSLAPITVSSTTRFLPYLYYAHYFPLLSSSTPTIALVIGPPLGLPARPGKRPDRCDSQASLPTFQNTKRPSVRRLVKAFFSVVQVLEPPLAEPLRCKRCRDRSFEDPPDRRFRREFPKSCHLRRSADYICRPFLHAFPRSSDLLPYVHQPYSPLTPPLM